MQHLPSRYKQDESRDRSEGELPHPDVGYLPTERSAAFVCTGDHRSPPRLAAEEIVPFLRAPAAAMKPLATINTPATRD